MAATEVRRREFLKAVGIGAAAVAVPRGARRAAGGGGAGDSPRPNILWISAEDISPTLGCYGDKYATTPQLDKFAASGVRYDRAFTHAPVCAPARSGIITGMYPGSIGTTWMRCKGVPPADARCFTEYLRAAGYFCTNRSKTDYQFAPPGSAWDICGGGGHWRRRPEKDQPFFAVINLGVTHESSTRVWTPGKQAHDPGRAPLPPYYPDTPVVRQNIACYYDKMTQLDGQVRRILDELEADGLTGSTIVWFWGDHGWGLTRGKRWVYDSGMRVPLMVRVPPKLRKWAGCGEAESVSPGTACGELVSFIDFAPTMLSLAGIPIPKHMQGQAFLGPQKADPREHVFCARDRMDETLDCIRAVRGKRFKYIRNYMPHLTRGQHIAYMDRTPILKEMRRLHAAGKLEGGPQMQYFEPTKPVRELYDTLADPHEVDNLAAEAKYADVVKRMDAALLTWQKDIGDVGMIPEGEFNAMKGGGKAAPPVFSAARPAAAGEPVRVTITCPTPGASITYQVTKAPAGEAKGGVPSGIFLRAKDATIHGTGARKTGDAITSYRGKDTTLSWEVRIDKAGRMPVHLLQANQGAGGSVFELAVGELKLTGTIRHTETWDDYVYVKVGEIDLPQPGKYTVRLTPKKQVQGRLGNVGAVVLNGKNLPARRAVAAASAPSLLYSKPVELRSGQRLLAKAWRLGYTPSGLAAYRYGDEAPTAPPAPAEAGPSWRRKLDKSGLIERILELKRLDGKGAEARAKYLAVLKDKDASMRYWAVLGLRFACKDAASIAKATAAVGALRQDPSKSVRDAAAEALRIWGKAR